MRAVQLQIQKVIADAHIDERIAEAMREAQPRIDAAVARAQREAADAKRRAGRMQSEVPAPDTAPAR
jgi:vacuolar-type H+-ATPase subunit H